MGFQRLLIALAAVSVWHHASQIGCVEGFSASTNPLLPINAQNKAGGNNNPLGLAEPPKQQEGYRDEVLDDQDEKIPPAEYYLGKPSSFVEEDIPLPTFWEMNQGFVIKLVFPPNQCKYFHKFPSVLSRRLGGLISSCRLHCALTSSLLQPMIVFHGTSRLSAA